MDTLNKDCEKVLDTFLPSRLELWFERRLRYLALATLGPLEVKGQGRMNGVTVF